MRGPRPSSPQKPREEPRRPARPALQAIREDKDQIVEAMLAEARQGSYLHAKFLFEFAGISSADDEGNAAHQQSLAELLLEKLELVPDPRLEGENA
jgi:hypothetical protein